MRCKIVVNTPVGQGVRSEQTLRKFILGFNKKSVETKIVSDSCFEWYMDVDARRYKKLCRNVYGFKTFSEAIIDNAIMKKGSEIAIGKEQAAELRDMFLNKTTIDIFGLG